MKWINKRFYKMGLKISLLKKKGIGELSEKFY